MKISCQSCHSKYNVADEKVQGKIVKIRCRKCGATIVLNAIAGALANGSVPAPAPPAAESAPAGGEGEWHVSVADNDQRTMSLAGLVEAYNAGLVAQDTFIWTEGMGDWKPLSEVDVVVAALHAAVSPPPAASAPAPAPAYDYGLSAPVAASPAYEAEGRPRAAASVRAPAYEGGFASQAPAPEPRRAAVVKREARARDLFATRSGEELQVNAPVAQASAPLLGDDSRLTGQRNENSVLFSLDHLTKNTEPQRSDDIGNARSKDDSGLIDLKALSAKAESMRPPTLLDANAISVPLAPPLGFAAPLGSPLGGFGPASEAQPKSKLPLVLGAGAGVALLLVLGIVIGLKIGGGATPAAAGTASAAPVAAPASAEATPSASAASDGPVASASAAASGSAHAPALGPPKPHPLGGGSAFKQGGPAMKPASGAVGGTTSGGGGGSAGAAVGGSAAGGGAAAGGGSPAPAKKGDCGCNGDLMCMMKCSTHP